MEEGIILFSGLYLMVTDTILLKIGMTLSNLNGILKAQDESSNLKRPFWDDRVLIYKDGENGGNYIAFQWKIGKIFKNLKTQIYELRRT